MIKIFMEKERERKDMINNKFITQNDKKRSLSFFFFILHIRIKNIITIKGNKKGQEINP